MLQDFLKRTGRLDDDDPADGGGDLSGEERTIGGDTGGGTRGQLRKYEGVHVGTGRDGHGHGEG